MRSINVAPVANLTKRERVEMLLDHWQDFHETLHSVDEAGGSDDPVSGITGMPSMFHHPSVVELRRAIAATRKVMPVSAAHMLAFYEAEWRNVTRLEKRKTRRGKVEVVEARKRERIVPRWVRRRKVDNGVAAVCAAFQGPVHVPSELLEDIVQAAA